MRMWKLDEIAELKAKVRLESLFPLTFHIELNSTLLPLYKLSNHEYEEIMHFYMDTGFISLDDYHNINIMNILYLGYYEEDGVIFHFFLVPLPPYNGKMKIIFLSNSQRFRPHDEQDFSLIIALLCGKKLFNEG